MGKTIKRNNPRNNNFCNLDDVLNCKVRCRRGEKNYPYGCFEPEFEPEPEIQEYGFDNSSEISFGNITGKHYD